ncbi:MAG: glycosyltransferase [Rhodocyclales bacterium]|nr:glycosyltransferase [Rhodocyclales bacterium]MDB5887134.1 glycosyltransferase [Rhodocyclales bacterium]
MQQSVLDRRLQWLLFLLPLAAFLFRLGSVPLFDVDEGAFSEATREMFERHDFVSTWLNGAPRFDKPILIYWCQAFFVWLFGPNEWAFRMPSALAAAAWCWAVGMFAGEQERKNGTSDGRHAAIFGTTVAVTSLGVILIGRAATADALLNMLIALSLFDSWRHLESGKRAPLLRSYLWIGLGMLTKGPVALLIPAATTLIYCASCHRLRDWTRSVFDPLGWLVLLVVTVPWYAAELSIHGQAFIDGFLLKHNVERFSGSLEGHSGSIFYYLLIVPLLLLPWLTWLAASLFKLKRDLQDTTHPVRRFLWIWAIFVIVFFSLSGTKLPHYGLYGCTPLFVLIALHRDVVRNARIGALPAIVILCLALTLPSLLGDALAKGWIKDPFYILQLSRIAEVKLDGYHGITSVTLVVAIMAIFVLHSDAWRRVSVVAVMALISITTAVAPLVGELLQGPIMRAGLAARAFKEPAVLWNFHAPSFSVYRRAVTPSEQAQPGQIALTRADRLPPDAKVDILQREGGVLLVRIKAVQP